MKRKDRIKAISEEIKTPDPATKFARRRPGKDVCYYSKSVKRWQKARAKANKAAKALEAASVPSPLIYNIFK